MQMKHISQFLPHAGAQSRGEKEGGGVSSSGVQEDRRWRGRALPQR